MATLYDYIASLTVDGSPVVWSDKPLTGSQIDAAAGNPYIRVDELTEAPRYALYEHQDVLQGFVDVQIFQAPNEARPPDRTLAMGLYFDLWDAPSNVDEWTYGQQLVAMFREVSIPPKYDQDSGGLSGVIRFRLLLPRG